MNEKRKPHRRRFGFMEGQDRIFSLNSIYRTSIFGNERVSEMTRAGHADFDPVGWQDPTEDLDDSELSDHERRQAIARERMRREGRV